MHFDFSIIIPTYNRPKQLMDCLNGIAEMRYPHDQYEIIVVDDGSDISIDISDVQSSTNVTLLRQINKGPAAARNLGAECARGRFLAFIDDDCAPAPDWLSMLSEFLNKEPECLVGGYVENILTNNSYASASQLIIEMAYDYFQTSHNNNMFFSSNNMALSKELFCSLGGFNPAFRTSEDRDLCDRWIMTGYRLRYVPGAIIYHAHHLELHSFFKQHFNYGRGAWKFNRAHAGRGAPDSTLKIGFYFGILRRISEKLYGKPHRIVLQLFCLLGLWQIANVLGFSCEALNTFMRPERKTDEIF
jgi:GT2 family glycosyltransferase